MNTKNYLLLTGLLIIMSAFTINSSINWTISEGYSVKFAGTDAEGIFKSLEGDVQFDESNVNASSFSFTIQVSSINTGNGTKNKHAVSDKWFDADQFPNIKFNSTKVIKTDAGYEVEGNMEIHGVTKMMNIPFTFNNNTFSSKFSVNRMDFGVGTMKGMSKKVSDEIKLEVSIPVSK